jgi:hypothetical protein
LTILIWRENCFFHPDKNDNGFQTMKLLNTTLFAALSLAAIPAAQAASEVYGMGWNQLPGACTLASGSANSYGNSYQCAEENVNTYGGPKGLTVTAYAGANNSSANFQDANVQDYGTTGFGVQNRNEGTSGTAPNHAADNEGSTDMLVFSFANSFALTDVMIGWPSSGYDTDISVLAYTGSGNPVADITGSKVNNLLTSGWSLVGNYNNLDDGVYKSVNAGQISSSYWIISAFSGFGASGGDSSLDYFKLQKIAGNFSCANSNDPSCSSGSGSVPEPVSIALVAVALAGVASTRRRKRAGVIDT